MSIVIGIPSVKRSGASYLFNTLQSLFHDMYPANEERVCVVVFLAEEDQSFVESTGKLVAWFSLFIIVICSNILRVCLPCFSRVILIFRKITSWLIFGDYHYSANLFIIIH